MAGAQKVREGVWRKWGEGSRPHLGVPRRGELPSRCLRSLRKVEGAGKGALLSLPEPHCAAG